MRTSDLVELLRQRIEDAWLAGRAANSHRPSALLSALSALVESLPGGDGAADSHDDVDVAQAVARALLRVDGAVAERAGEQR